MRAEILPLFLTLCTPFETLGYVIPALNMCSETKNSSRELILFKNSMDLTNISSDVCSCNLQSKKGFYISLKRLKITNKSDDLGNKVIGITRNNDTWDLNLAETNTYLTRSDCLIISGNISGPFRPSCLRNISAPITLETFNNLTADSYIYLYILAEGTVNVSCTLKNESDISEFFNTTKEKKTAASCSGNTSSSNTTDATDSNCDNTTVSEEDSTTDGSTATSFASVTSSTPDPNVTVYAFYRSALAKQQEAERLMTASMIMLPIAGIVLLACLLILVIAFRKQRYSKKTHSIKRKGSTRKVQKQEPPSYYEEVDEDLHISTTGPTEITKDEHSYNIHTSGTVYDVATTIGVQAKGKSSDNVSALNSQNYDVATAISPQGVISLITSGNDDSDYNVASYNPQKKTMSAGVDETYDVTQCVVMDKFPGDSDGMIYETGTEQDNLDRSNDLAVGVSQESLISSEIHYEPAELKSVSNPLPSVETLPKDDNIYSLQKMVSVEEKPDDIKDEEVIYDNDEKNRELATSDERVSFATDVLDDELYANFSSLKSEDHESVEILEEDPSNFEDEDEIYINHAMPASGRKDSLESLQNTKRTSLVLESNPTKRPGYINVTLAKAKENLTPELTDSSDAAGDETFQSQGFGVTGSTVSLLNSDSDSEIYANFKAGEDNAKEPKKAKKAKNTKEPKETRSSRQRESKAVEVVVLPQPSTSTAGDAPPRQPQKKGHKQSSSVDESSKFQRKPDSRKQRTRSDDTLLLNQIPSSASGSENDVLMVNNVMYEGMNTGSPNPNAEFSNEAIANLSSDTDLDQYIFLQKENDEDDDVMIMMNNDLYESFNCGGVCLLPENVSKEMKDKLLEKKLHCTCK